ncbi:HTH-type transcriptional regulator GltR [Rhodococcus fascians]|uniref:LysR family transcriptional regulator n=1 Tax=Nocardiaceae TaxID=85025 RepID=UPI000B9A26A6|nr:LysR family transcriptional regulator [Rhodococcus sp. 06-1474-1B]NIL87455.1 HTH-type transcriptional regulator GltR [Rhodococcus fascians]OZD46964.1 hypothetical protein CH266_19260 [Rhodococcus sp. 06-1474-1B]OZD52471.1 hypothetical protein CH252_13740 [Rhodococcus sp. 06-1477-1B]
MDLRGLEAFVAVAELSSVTEAARKLGYAQSTVTTQIKNLEKDLRVTLLNRGSTGMKLSSEGLLFLPHARAVLAAISEARQSVRGDELRGPMVLGAMESITSSRILPMFEYLSNMHPGLTVQLRPSLCAEAIEAVGRGDLDAAFVVDDRTTLPGVRTEVLCEEPLALVCGPRHEYAHQAAVTLDEIRATRVVGTEPGCAYRDRFEALLSRPDGEPFPIVELGGVEAIRRALLTIDAVALLPRVTVKDALDAEELIEVAWEVPFTVRTLLLHPESRRVTRKVAELLVAARKVAGEQTTSAP